MGSIKTLGAEVDALCEENELLKVLVLRLAVAAVDPAAFDDVHGYVAEVFAFAETRSADQDPPESGEIDALTAIVLEEYEFEGEDEDEPETVEAEEAEA